MNDVFDDLEHEKLVRRWQSRGGFDWSEEKTQRAAMRDTFSEAHIKPRKNLVADFSVGGSLIDVKNSFSASHQRKNTGGKRDSVLGFSPSSRRRLLKALSSLRIDAIPVFLTLTYHKEEKTKGNKKHIINFYKRIVRRFPKASFCWRMEYQARGVVHFHLLAWGVDFRWLNARRVNLSGHKFATNVSKIWCDVSGQSFDEDAMSASVRVEKIRSSRGVFSYASKYLSKDERDEKRNDGRHWGFMGRHNLPVADKVRFYFRDEQHYDNFRRYARRLSKGRVAVGKNSFFLLSPNPKSIVDALCREVVGVVERVARVPKVLPVPTVPTTFRDVSHLLTKNKVQSGHWLEVRESVLSFNT